MKVKLIVVLTGAVLVLAGCGATAAPAKDCTAAGVMYTHTGTNRPAATQAAPTSDPAPAPSTPDTAAFGSTATYPDGLVLTVSKGTAFTPSQYAAGTTGFKSFVKYTITVVNGTGKVFDARVHCQCAVRQP